MKKYMLILLFIFVPFLLSADPITVMESLLTEREADFGKAAYLVFTAAKLIPEDATTEAALEMLREKGWKRMRTEPGPPTMLGDFSYMIMKSFNLSGGIMFSIIPGPRYSAREMKFRGFTSGDTAVTRILSGEDVVRIIGRVLEFQEALQ